MRGLVVAAVLMAGCDLQQSIENLDPKVTFSTMVEEQVPEQEVPGSPLPGPLASVFPIQMDLDLQQKLDAMKTGPVDTITLSSLDLSITKTSEPSGDHDDWSFVDSVDVFVASSKSGSKLPKVKIATASKPGAVQTMMFVPVTGVNLKPYIDEGSVVSSTGSGHAPDDTVSFDGMAVFDASAGL